MHEAQEKSFYFSLFLQVMEVKEVHLPGLDSHGIGLTTMEAPGKWEFCYRDWIL